MALKISVKVKVDPLYMRDLGLKLTCATAASDSESKGPVRSGFIGP